MLQMSFEFFGVHEVGSINAPGKICPRPSLGAGGDRGKVSMDFFESIFGGEAVVCPKNFRLTVLHKLIRPADSLNRTSDSLVVKELNDACSKSMEEDVILEGADDFRFARFCQNELGVERLDETGINESDRKALFFESFGDGFSHFKHRAESD